MSRYFVRISTKKQKSLVRHYKAFTLTELLIVIAVIAILAALLFPVFVQARGKAREAVCTFNFKQQALSILLYQQDYDELMPPSYYGDGNWQSPPSMFLGQLVQPYLKNQQVYKCPSDPATDYQRMTVELPFSITQQPISRQQQDFNLGFKNDFGFNYQYLSPNGTHDNLNWFSVPTPLAAIGAPAQLVLALDSVWDRDLDGNPIGGGGGLVEPPCRYDSNGDSFPASSQFINRNAWGGWQPSYPKSGEVYGYVWPWHGEFATVAFCDGHVKALPVPALSAGCDVKDNWGGKITDTAKYLWDLR